MQYIDYIEINGVRGDIPVNQSGKGAPTTSTEGAVAQIYMDENTGDLYKCTQATKTVFTWVKIEAGSDGTVTVDSALSSTSENPVQNKVVKAALDGKQDKGNYLTTETDPTVPAWAKAAQKPTYTASEVGALPADTVIPDAYTLPVATSSQLGGVKPVAKTSDMTQNVGVDANGKLYTAPSASQGSYELPTASSSVLGGVKADSAQSTDTQAVRIGTDGKLYTSPGSGGSSGDSPVKLIANNDSTNKKPLRSIDSGTYVLSGYFTSYEGGTESFTFNSGMVVAILKESSKSYVQVFYPKSNVIQYLEITDSAVTRKDAKLVNMESVANRVSAITSSSDTSHYPSAKAVYDAIQSSGVPQTGSTAPETTTKGVVGQPYFVIVDNAVTEMYVCTSALIGSYTWDKVEFGGNYTLPEATATALGGIRAENAQTTDTQAVRKGADGKLYTAPGTVTDAQVNTAVSSWLTEHPEATTTVADGSVTEAKLADKAVTVAKLEKSIADALDIEQHIYTEEKAPLIRYKYNSWVVDESGTNNGIAPILTPSKFRITNPSTTASITMNVQFLDSEDVETATISDAGTLKEQLYWNIPANETVEIETCEYGRTLAKYIRMRWTNYPLIAVDITAIYDSYNMPQPTMDTKSEFITDHKMRWTLHRVNNSRTYYSSWCIVPFYPDTEYYVFNAADPGGNDRLEVYGFPDDTILNEQMNTNNSFADSGGIDERAAIHVYKKILADGYPQKINSSDTNKKWMKIKTKTWDETKGCKYIGVTMGGYSTAMTYPYSSEEILTQDQIKSYFDNINETYSRIAYISRFSVKLDRHIYSQIVMRNDGLANDEGTYGMALTSQMPSPLANAKWALFGDSLTDTYGGHDLTGNYFASKIAREFNMTLDNRAKSGSNIYRGGSGNYVSVSGMIKLDEFVAEIDAGTTEQPDYITIAFGTNSFAAQIGTNEDTSETDTSVYGATKRFIEVLREKCPNSVFGFVLSPKQDWGTNDSQNLRAVDAARTAIKTVCDEYGVPYIDMSTQSGITVAMLPDGIHISNDQSQNLYYHAMRRFMIGL